MFTEHVLIALIAAGASIFAAGISILNTYLVHRLGKEQSKSNLSIASLEKHTNSMKDALVRITGESEYAKGLLQGKAENSEIP